MVGTAAVAGTVAGLGGLGGKSLVVLPHQIFIQMGETDGL